MTSYLILEIKKIDLIIISIINFLVKGPGQLGRYSDSLRAGRAGDRIPVGARFSAPVRTGPGGPPSLLYNEYRLFSGGKAAGAWC